QSPTSRELARRIDIGYRQFHLLGDSLMAITDLERKRFATFTRHAEEVTALVDPGLKIHLNLGGRDGPHRLADLSRLESDIAGIGAETGRYLRTRDPHHRVRVAAHESRFRATLNGLKALKLSDDEQARLTALEAAFGPFADEARELMGIADDLQTTYNGFIGSGATVERLVDEGIRSLARTDLLEAQQSA